MAQSNKVTDRGLSSKVKIIATLGIIVVLLASFVFYFIFQAQYEQQIRNTIFEKEEQRQIQYARSVSQNMASDLDSMMNRLYAISVSRPIQTSDYSSSDAAKLLEQTYTAVNKFSSTDGVYILDQNNKVANYFSPTIQKPEYIGYDASQLPFVQEYLKNLPNPYFSNAYYSVADGILKISLYYPIYNLDSEKCIGAVTMSLPVRPFLEQYGNLDDVNQQYINVLDRNATFLTAPVKTSIGKNFFSPELSQGSSNEATEHYKIVLSGQEHTQLFSFRNFGSRLATGEPVILGGKPQYFVFVITPTASIYAQIDSVIASQRTGFYILQGAIAGAITIALFFLLRWSRTIEKAVSQRTNELQLSNAKLASATKELREANIQLKAHDQIQREFINVAAHELRTPVQPILGVAEMLGAYPAKAAEEEEEAEEVRVKKKDLRMIGRNAARLERLSSDILDVSRIESGSLRITREQFDMNELVKEAIDDAKSHVDIGEVNILCPIENRQPINVTADRQRIMQAIGNLVNNAIRFTKPAGTISIAVEPQGDNVKVMVTDSGSGISEEMLPKLFTKFSTSTRAGTGTGLGLFISKAIIEAHGGRIWGHNNTGDKGATFGFLIPIKARLNMADTMEDGVTNKTSNSDLLALARDAFEEPK